MTISSDAIRKAGPYVGTGIATVFAFAFKTFAATDLSITLLTLATGVQQLLVLNTDYTVQLNANQETNPGGTVTTIGAISPIANTSTLTISGNAMPDTQGTDLVTPGPWVPDDVEKMVDRAMIAAQQLRDRAIKFPTIDSIAPIDLPKAELRKNTTLGFDGLGQLVCGAVLTVVAPIVAGQLIFGTGVGLAQDANLTWDNVNKRLATPLVTTNGAVNLGFSTNGVPAQWAIINGSNAFTPGVDNTQQIGAAASRISSIFTPIIDSGTIGSLSLKTNNGTTQATFSHTANAVNNFDITGAIAGADPRVQAVGVGANLNALFSAKGTGSILFYGNSFTTNNLELLAAAGANHIQIAAGTNPTLSGSAGNIAFGTNVQSDTAGARDLGASSTGWKRLYMDFTNTGTVGNVTINKAAGRVNLGAGATTLTLTNSLITAASKVTLQFASNPGNAVGVSLIAAPAAGSCVITCTPAVTNQTAIDFVVVNAD